MFYVIIISTPFVLYYAWRVYSLERKTSYSETERYAVARHMVAIMKVNGFIHTKAFGTENLPEDGGYVMFANHQGKYDSLGIIHVHEKPCTILIDKHRSNLIFVTQFIMLLRGIRMDKTSPKSQVRSILQVAEEVKAGRRYIVFPEGGYEQNKNHIQNFLPGAFKCAMKAKSPIVPVALVDSYKVFNTRGLSLLPVTTQVHFLKPLFYEDYKDMNSQQISSLVHDRIEEKLLQVCGE